MIVTVNDDTVEKEIKKSNKSVLLEFHASWAGQSRAMVPLLEDVDKKYGKNLKIIRVDVADSPEAVLNFGTKAYPEVLLLRDGRIIDRRIGVLTADELHEFIERNNIKPNK